MFKGKKYRNRAGGVHNLEPIVVRSLHTGWFKINDPNLLRVGSSRRFGEIGPEVLRTYFINPCQLVNERVIFVVFFARYLVGGGGGDIWALRNPKFPAKNMHTCFINGSTGTHGTRVQEFSIYL